MNEERRIVREEMKRWGRETRAAVRAETPRVSGRLRRDIATKFRTYRGNSVYWCAVGGKILRKAKDKEKYGNDYLGAGWRIHFITGPRRRRQAKNPSERPAWYRRRLKANRTKIPASNYMRRIGRRLAAIAAARIRSKLGQVVKQ